MANPAAAATAHKRAGFALRSLTAAATLGLLGGCAMIPGGPAVREVAAQLTAAPPPRIPAMIAPAITLTETPAANSAMDVAGLGPQRALSSTGSAARWSYLPGADAFNALVATMVLDHLHEKAATTGTTYVPEAHDVSANLSPRGCVPGSSYRTGKEILADPTLAPPPNDAESLAIVCDVSVATGTFFGERLRFVRGNAQGVTADSVESLYTDYTSGQAVRSGELVAPEALPRLYDSIAALVPQTPAMTDALLESLRGSLRNIAFAKDGSALLSIDQGLFPGLPTAEGQGIVTIPPELIPHYLTTMGQGISRSLAAGTPWVPGPPVSPGRSYVNCQLSACIALTFDDGPAQNTPQLLKELASKQAAATFFLLGSNVAKFPDVAKQIADGGHELGNHSWGHPKLTTLPGKSVRDEIGGTNRAILEATGITPQLMRPPYGEWNRKVLDIGQMPLILWSVDTNDWKKPPRDVLTASIVNGSTVGDIVLLHDIHPETVAAVPDILQGLLARGFSPVTVSQLFGATPGIGEVHYREGS